MLNNNTTTTNMVGKKVKASRRGGRESTSMYLNTELWRDVKKAAIDLEITATEFVEAALKQELMRLKKA